MESRKTLTDTVPYELCGVRLDQALARMFPDYSRSRIQQWIKEGHVRVDGHACKARDKVVGGESIVLEVVQEAVEEARPEAIPLDIVFEDDHILVVNKPAGLVVHPAAGNPHGTLMNALLHHDPLLDRLPRAGIVHRLDKDTTGLMVVARTLEARTSLVEQLQARSVKREYDAVVQGHIIAGGTVDAPIGRHPVDRKRMSVREGGKPAVTHYRVEERFDAHTHIRASLETGRTHQIRVHMAHIHHPLVGDPVYGGRFRKPRGASDRLVRTLREFPRQALHGRRLSLVHPRTGQEMEWQAPLPEDLESLLGILREEAGSR